MYTLNLNNQYGKKTIGIFSNDEQLAYYAFFNGDYKSHLLDPSVDTQIELIDVEGNKLSNQQLDIIIEKFFPKETKKITARKESSNNFISNIFSRFQEHWLVTYQKEQLHVSDKVRHENKKKTLWSFFIYLN